MKIYQWIDRLFDTYSKRSCFVAILVLVYWTWQNIWQGVFMFDLAHVSNYDTLFSFYENLSQYSHALLIEIVLDMISSNSVSLISILNAVVNNVRIIDILAVIFTVILFMKSRQKNELDLFDCSLYIDVCCSRGKLVLRISSFIY